MYSITCDTLGLYARSAADLSLLCDVFNLVDDVPPPAAPLDLSTASFAFVRTCQWPKATSGTVDAFDKAQELLKKHGAKVEVVELPAEFDEVPAWHARVLQGEGRSAFHDLAMTSYPVLDPWIQHHIDNKSAVSRKMLTEAYDGIARLRPVIDEIAGKYTALVTPSVVDEAPVIMDARRLTGDASFNLIWCALSSDGSVATADSGLTGLVCTCPSSTCPASRAPTTCLSASRSSGRVSAIRRSAGSPRLSARSLRARVASSTRCKAVIWEKRSTLQKKMWLGHAPTSTGAAYEKKAPTTPQRTRETMRGMAELAGPAAPPVLAGTDSCSPDAGAAVSSCVVVVASVT